MQMMRKMCVRNLADRVEVLTEEIREYAVET